MPKKLKTVVKSLYSHEIRKDVNLDALSSLKLEDAWPFIRDDIEREVGNSQLVCIPHLTEPHLYTPTSLFVQEHDSLELRPLGPLGALLDTAATPVHLLQQLQQLIKPDPTFLFPHESVKITLQDESLKNKVRVIMVNVTRASAPTNILSANSQLYLAPNPFLSEGCSLVCVSSALFVGTLEFRVTRASRSRIFHLGQRSPLLLALRRFRLTPERCLVPEKELGPSDAARLRWLRCDPADRLCTDPLCTDQLCADTSALAL